MRTFKKILCAVSALVVCLSTLLLSACSTPKVAMTVDGKEYQTGEYLAYMFNTYNFLFYQQGLAQYAQYQMDPWAQEIPYKKEGQDEKKLSTADFIKQTAQDTIVRQKAIENKLKEANLAPLPKDLENVEKGLKDLKGDAMISFGFNAAHYTSMYKATNLNERALFYGTYDNKGSKAMTETEIRKYFDDNFLSYKSIEISLVDKDGKDLSEADVKKANDRLQAYMNLYTTGKDFDKVIKQYNDDETAATATTNGATTTTAATAATTVAQATTTAMGTTVTQAGTSAGSATTTAAPKEDPKENKDPNRKDIDAGTYGDEDFTNAIKSIAKFNEAKIVEYKKGGTAKTAALILRLDPEQRLDSKEYFKESRDGIIYGAKFEEFNKELEAYIKTLTVEINQKAVKMCDPKSFQK